MWHIDMLIYSKHAIGATDEVCYGGFSEERWIKNMLRYEKFVTITPFTAISIKTAPMSTNQFGKTLGLSMKATPTLAEVARTTAKYHCSRL
jgi:hypothetical protein